MSQYLVYFTKQANSAEAKEEMSPIKTFTITDVDDLKEFHSNLSDEGVISVDYDVFFVDFHRKLKDIENTIKLSYLGKDGIQLNIEQILEFKNVPAGRSLCEIVAMIFYAATMYDLVHDGGIKYTPLVFQVVSSPSEVINPETFNWDMKKLNNSLNGVLGLTCFLEYNDDGTVHKSVDLDE